MQASDEEFLEYLPTPAETRAGCERFRAMWSSGERRKRAARGVEPVPWEAATIPLDAALREILLRFDSYETL